MGLRVVVGSDVDVDFGLSLLISKELPRHPLGFPRFLGQSISFEFGTVLTLMRLVDAPTAYTNKYLSRLLQSVHDTNLKHNKGNTLFRLPFS